MEVQSHFARKKTFLLYTRKEKKYLNLRPAPEDSVLECM